MNAIKLILLSLLVFIGNATKMRGEEFRTDINPALLYYQAFIMEGDQPQTDRDYLDSTQWRGKKLPERFGILVSGEDTKFRLLRQAAKSTVPCDWGIDLSPGPATILPHLARCKSIAVMVPYRVLWDLQNGRQAEARDDLLATFTLGRNSSRDGTLVGALVQFAIEHIVLSTVAENFDRFSTEILQQLAEGFDAAPSAGTVAASMRVEKASHDWIERKILKLRNENPGNDAEVMSVIHTIMNDDSETPNQWWQQLLEATGSTSEGFLKLVRDEDSFYQRLGVMMALPPHQFEDQIQQFQDYVLKASNPLSQHLAPAIIKARTKELEAEVKLAMFQAAVEYKAHGQQGFRAVGDPLGQGPFELQRFRFQGVDRGFELKSAYSGPRSPFAMIFVETEGPPFVVDGVHAGKPAGP